MYKSGIWSCGKENRIVRPAFLGKEFFGLENVREWGVLFELCIARFFGLMEGWLGHISQYISDRMYAFLLVVDIGSYQCTGAQKNSIA